MRSLPGWQDRVKPRCGRMPKSQQALLFRSFAKFRYEKTAVNSSGRNFKHSGPGLPRMGTWVQTKDLMGAVPSSVSRQDDWP